MQEFERKMKKEEDKKSCGVLERKYHEQKMKIKDNVKIKRDQRAKLTDWGGGRHEE